MKNYLKMLLFFCVISFTACTKETFPIDEQLGNGKAAARNVNTDSQYVAPSRISFDEEIFDNPLEINSALVYTSKENAKTILDSATHYFNGNCSPTVKASEDEIKTNVAFEQISIMQSGQFLSKEGRPIISHGSNDTIQLIVKGFRYNSYQIRLRLSKFTDDFTVQLYDNFLKKFTNIPISGEINIPFSLKEIESYSPTRFKIFIHRN